VCVAPAHRLFPNPTQLTILPSLPVSPTGRRRGLGGRICVSAVAGRWLRIVFGSEAEPLSFIIIILASHPSTPYTHSTRTHRARVSSSSPLLPSLRGCRCRRARATRSIMLPAVLRRLGRSTAGVALAKVRPPLPAAGHLLVRSVQGEHLTLDIPSFFFCMHVLLSCHCLSHPLPTPSPPPLRPLNQPPPLASTAAVPS